MAVPNVVFPKLREQIKVAEESAMDIANLLGISYGSVLNKLSGRTAFLLPEARTIANHYGVSIDELFFLNTERAS